MRYRKLSASGDYTFGKEAGNFFVDSPETVGQAIKTALLLIQGEWFIDTEAGVPYNTQILGAGTKQSYDIAIQTAILNVFGVSGITQYTSTINQTTRKVSINCTVNTIYGEATFRIEQKPFAYSQGRLDSTFILDSSILM